MGRLSLCLLGHFRAERDGRPLAGIESAKGRALLAYLAVEAHRSHARSELTWLLWPDVPDAVALTNLRQTLANLRNALGDRPNPVPYLLIERDSIQFNAASDYQLDVTEFRQLLQTCTQHRHRHPARCASCAQRFARVSALYQGDFLAHFPSVDSEPFEQWVEAQREPLQQQALGALERLGAYHEQRGEYEQALGYARRQVALAPWHEAGHRKVITLLARLGQRSAALTHYHRMVEVLDEELGVEPDAESRQLYEQLYAGEANEIGSHALPKHNLPIASNRFIGREAVLAQLHALLEDPANRLVTVVGPGGIGKTRLALQVASKQRYAYQDGVYFVALAPIQDPELVVSATMQALGIKEVAGEAFLEPVKQFLRDKELLLLLDNFEQVVEAASLVAELLSVAPRLQVLVTSREALNLSGEHVFPVPPLLLPDAVRSSLDVLTENEALQLFVQRAQAVKPSFTLTEENALTVAEICAQVEGLPLAIELAASRVKTLSPLAILERLQHRLQLLTGGPRDLPRRQQTLRATIDWSYQLLTEEEQRLFARLGVFVGGWTLGAAEAVCNPSQELGMDVLDGLGALVDKSLVQQWETGDGEVRFGMLETIREYAREHLAASAEAKEVWRCHAEYFLTIAEAADVHLQEGKETNRWVTHLEAEQDNLRAVLEWAREQQEEEVALRLASALTRFWDCKGYFYREGREQLEQVLAWTKDRSTAVRAKALENFGILLSIQDLPRSRQLLEKSLAIWRELGNQEAIGRTLAYLGVTVYVLGDSAYAHRLWQESLAIFEALGNNLGVAKALFYLAWKAEDAGDYAGSRTFLERSLELCRAGGYRRVEARVVALLVSIDYKEETRRASPPKGALRESTSERLPPLQGLSPPRRALAPLPLTGTREDLFPDYISNLHKSVTILQELGFSSTRDGHFNLLGLMAVAQGDFASGRVLFTESLAQAVEMGSSLWMLEAIEHFAELEISQGDFERGIRLWSAVESIAGKLNHSLTVSEHSKVERATADARTRMGEKAFAAAWVEGQAMTLEQAVAYALEAG